MLLDLKKKINVFLLFLIFLHSNVMAQGETTYGPYENFKSSVLNNVNDYRKYNFVTIIGIDSSTSMTNQNQFNIACKLANIFIQDNLIPGDEFYLFHFGPEPYPYYEITLIPSEPREAVKEIGNIQAKILELTTNPDKGTDLNYAYYHALSFIEKDKNKNYLILLFTDHNSDVGEINWIKNGDNNNKLNQLKALLNEKGKEKVDPITSDSSLWVVWAYYMGNNTLISNIEVSPSDPPDTTPRSKWNKDLNDLRHVGQNKVKFTPHVLDSDTKAPIAKYELSFTNMNSKSKVNPTEGGQYFLEPAPYSIDVLSEGYENFHGEFTITEGMADITQDILLKKSPPSSPIWILFLLLFLIIVAIVAFMIMKSIPLSVDMIPGGEERQFSLRVNDFLLIGGQEDRAKNVFPVSGAEDILVRITHVMPQRLRIDRVSGEGSLKITYEGDCELKTGSAIMGNHSQIEFIDKISGLKHTINISRGHSHTPLPSSDKKKDDEDGDDWMS